MIVLKFTVLKFSSKRIVAAFGFLSRHKFHSGNDVKFKIFQKSRRNNHLKSFRRRLIGLPSLAIPFITSRLSSIKQTDAKDRVSAAGGCLKSFNGGKDKVDSAVEFTFPWAAFLSLLKPYALLLAVAVITAVFAAILNIQIPLELGVLINAASELKCGSILLSALYEPALKLLTLYSIQSALTTLYISVLSIVGERVACDLRSKLFGSFLRQDIEFFDQRRTGELVARLSGDVQDFKSSFKQIISQGLRSVTQSIGCTISLYLISPKMTLITLAILPGLVITGTAIGSLLRTLSKHAQKQIAIATAVAEEALSNIRTVKAFAMEETEQNTYMRELERSRTLNEALGIGIGFFQGISNFVLNGVTLGVIYGGSHLMNSGEIGAGQLMSFLVTSQVLQKSLAQIFVLFGQVVKGTSAGARIFEFIDRKPSIGDYGSDIIPEEALMGEVRFQNVSFSYPSRPDFTVLKDFSLVIPPGRVLALCGLSGGGKSTAAALLERFYDVDSGTISIDDRDIKTLDRKWLRGQAIGFISQEPVLFHSTIKENIRYGKPGASDKEVFEAARTANADNFIRSFPDSYDTVVGERGVTLSGGQKQRIAIARALLKNPPILILDEATSALDAESERLVQEALEKAEKGRTVLVIAHRLSTLKNADYIAVVANKKISEIGTQESLMRRRGLYWQLVQHQQNET